MLEILADRTYRHLFAAQVTALAGTGLATIALGLLAYDLAEEDAAMVLGAVFTIKMAAYVGVAPIAGAFADRIPRRALLVALDIVRAAAALALPFVTEVWQLYLLIFVLQSASAAFTPTFQATIPDVLPEESRYTRALSLSRLAYDLENIFSPTLAALLLAMMSYDALFLGTAAGFLASALLVVSVFLPSTAPKAPRSVYERTTRGVRIYLATPRLRGLLALNLAAAAAGAMVLVNTVVLVRGGLGLGESAVAWAMAAFGGGSMLAALALPRLLDRTPERTVMLTSAALMIAGPVRARRVHSGRRTLLAPPARRMGRGGNRLFRRTHAVGTASAALLEPRGQARALRGAVRAQPRLLAGDLSAVGLVDDRLWRVRGACRVERAGSVRRGARAAAVAALRPGRDRASSRRPPSRSPAPARRGRTRSSLHDR